MTRICMELLTGIIFLCTLLLAEECEDSGMQEGHLSSLPEDVQVYIYRVLRNYGYISKKLNFSEILIPEDSVNLVEKKMDIQVHGEPELKQVPFLDTKTGQTIYQKRWTRGMKTISFLYDSSWAFTVQSISSSSEYFQYSVTVSKDSQGFFSLTSLQETVYISLLDTDERVRVASVNLWNHNHWEVREIVLQNTLGSMNADVIAFQEVRSRKYSHILNDFGRSQVMDILDMLKGISDDKWYWYFEPAMNFLEHSSGNAEIVEEGLAIFSRFPVLVADRILLSRDSKDPSDFHQRICQRMIVSVRNGVPLEILNTHVSLSEKARKRTLPEIVSSSLGILPSVILGDFNAEANDVIPLMNSHGFDDAWDYLHSRNMPNQGYTFNSWNLTKRIDFALFQRLSTESPFTIFNSRYLIFPENIELFGRHPISFPRLEAVGGVHDSQDLLYPSDHLFIALDVKIQSQTWVK